MLTYIGFSPQCDFLVLLTVTALTEDFPILLIYMAFILHCFEQSFPEVFYLEKCVVELKYVQIIFEIFPFRSWRLILFLRGGVSVEQIWCRFGEQATSTLAFCSSWEVILPCYKQLQGEFPWLQMEVPSYRCGKWVVCLQCGPKGSDALASIFAYNRLKYPKAAIISWVFPYKLSKCTVKGRQWIGFYTTVS